MGRDIISRITLRIEVRNKHYIEHAISQTENAPCSDQLKTTWVGVPGKAYFFDSPDAGRQDDAVYVGSHERLPNQHDESPDFYVVSTYCN